MKAYLGSLLILFACTGLLAQDSTIVIVKTGNKITDVLTPADIYYYPEYTNAKVFFRDGTKAMAKMNYNRLFGQMLFIDPKGDTLALANEKTIKFITIIKDTFYFGENYMRLIADHGNVKLAESQNWVVADIRKIGTFDKPVTTVAVTSFSTYSDGLDGAKSKDLVMNEDIVLKNETRYYFGDEYSHFVPADKKGISQLFNKRQRDIENYLKENKLNFNKKDDLEKLAQFLAKIQ